jgi:hypothetical protein
MHMAGEQYGQNREAGDEGTEFFSLHLSRRLASNRVKMAVDAKTGDQFIRLDGGPGIIAGSRGLVNLTQQYAAGAARVESCQAVGNGTVWTPEMEGRWISFDADTTKNGHRQWYLIERFISPTRLQLVARTYWGKYNYKGSARADGAYRICPYTEMSDGDANRYSEGLKVTPLATDWKKDDEVEAIAGPQTTFRLGWWELGGEFLPQDHAAGLGIAWNGDKPTSEGALITYNWGIGLEVHNGNTGMVLYNTKAGIQAYKESPVLISVIRDDPYRFQLGQNKDGFVIEDYANRPWVSLGAKGVTVHGNGTITGNARTRGRTAFSGDGNTLAFTIKFPAKFDTAPFVVASPNLPIGMGVTAVTPDGCTVTFATAPPAGKDNVVVTWMVQE